ncbi:MAG TPA: uridine diphosphate-N-acetylglucosamine-binding protein YvcK [Acidimicrobiales bacterium]
MSGPRVVALGGGHGTAVTLRAARRYASHVTAIVSVADDGGSSGRLRQALGIPPPGDLRRCLVALSDDAPLAKAFEHRFGADAGELQGHALGNLVIAGLADATGDFTAALAEAGRLLGIQGDVFPATVEPVVLKAAAEHGEVQGQVAVATAGRIVNLSLVPPDPAPPQAALDAIAAADQIVLGPGSLFTSVLAVAVVPAIRDAIAASAAPFVYVCNLRSSTETPRFDVAAHVDALLAHGVVPDLVLYDDRSIPVGVLDVPGKAVTLAIDEIASAHDPVQLAKALADLVG